MVTCLRNVSKPDPVMVGLLFRGSCEIRMGVIAATGKVAPFKFMETALNALYEFCIAATGATVILGVMFVVLVVRHNHRQN